MLEISSKKARYKHTLLKMAQNHENILKNDELVAGNTSQKIKLPEFSDCNLLIRWSLNLSLESSLFFLLDTRCGTPLIWSISQ